MPETITFDQGGPEYVFERDCLAFRAHVDGKPVTCLVTAEFLIMAHFGARGPSEDMLREAYEAHKDGIQAVARDHIENGWVDEEKRVFLTTRFTRVKVTFGDELTNSSPLLAMAKRAHRVLLGIIGPSAGEVVVEWRAGDELSGLPAIALSISDPLSGQLVQQQFSTREAQDATSFPVRLARVWGAILRARSQNLILKSG